MNLVGKIFTMLILVMSLLFMAFAVAVYHTHRNWRDLAKDTQAEVTKYRDENAQLRDERLQMENRLAHERAARRAALARLETQVQEKQQQFEKRNQEYSDLLAQQRQALDAMETAQRQWISSRNRSRCCSRRSWWPNKTEINNSIEFGS